MPSEMHFYNSVRGGGAPQSAVSASGAQLSMRQARAHTVERCFDTSTCCSHVHFITVVYYQAFCPHSTEVIYLQLSAFIHDYVRYQPIWSLKRSVFRQAYCIPTVHIGWTTE